MTELLATPTTRSPRPGPRPRRRPSRRPSRRPRLRTVAGVAAGVVLAFGSAPAALAASPTPPVSGLVSGVGDDGLFGVQDPTYDGVYRESLAIGGLRAADVEVPHAAVDWLLRQQCADGSFTSYRPDTTKPCPPGGWDSNATAGAVQALVTVGSTDTRRAAGRAVSWLRTVQDPDGGFAFGAGGATDSNSTGLVLAALAAVGTDPATVTTGGRDPFDALEALQVGCAGGPVDVGGLAYQPQTDGSLFADTFASSGALLGVSGGAFPVTARPGTTEVPTPTCPAPARSSVPTTTPSSPPATVPASPPATLPSSPPSTTPATPATPASTAPVPASTPSASTVPTTTVTASTAPATAVTASTAPASTASASTAPVTRLAAAAATTVTASPRDSAAPARSRVVRPAVLTTSPTAVARYTGGYLARNMAAGHGLVVYAGVPDVGQTLNAVLGLSHLGVASGEVATALAALPGALPAWVVDAAGVDRPGSLGDAALAVSAAGADPGAFGGVDYGRRILATLRTAAVTPSPTRSATASATPDPTASPSPTDSASTAPTGSPTHSPTASPTATSSPTATGSPTASASPSASPTGPGPTVLPTSSGPPGVPPTAPGQPPVPAPPGGRLPRTGSSATVPLAVGGLLVLVCGVALRRSGRRRR